MIGALTAVLGNAPAELRELQHERIAEQTLIAQVHVERLKPVPDGPHQVRVGAASGVTFRGVRVESTCLHPEDARPDAASDRSGHGLERQRKAIVLIGGRAGIGGHDGHAVERQHGGLRAGVHKREVRPIQWHVGDEPRRGRAFIRRFHAGVRAGESVGPRVRNRRHRHGIAVERTRRLTRRVPPGEGVDGGWQRLEIPSEPAIAGRAGRIAGAPDVQACEM